MSDTVSAEVRSRMMKANRRRDTKPEIAVRRRLHGAGFRFRLDVAKLPGRPDIVLGRYRAAVFVHGCFWHRHPGCRHAAMPKSNIEFWEAKFRRNVERDRENVAKLFGEEWRVAVIWECALRKETVDRTVTRLAEWLEDDVKYLEEPPATG